MIRLMHAIAALAIAAVSSSAFGAETVTVDITKFAFTPKEITIKPGTKVVWVNHDEVPHTATSADKSLDSKALDTNDRYEHTFDNEGDVAYLCTVHPFMTGVIHVHR